MKFKGFASLGEALQSTIIILIPILVIIILLSIVFLILPQYGFNVHFPNPFE